MAKHTNSIEYQLKNLGKRIRQIRKEKGFRNYEQFAYQHDFNRSSYGRFESGEDLRMSSLLKVLEAFDISLEEFFSEGFEPLEKEDESSGK
ncbi:MAG: XRE family transcriptional regulator [Bacteroidetes bacterium]|nr:MAG: XRE family transcriptional regulator [Bacteroidota bacterium]